MFRSKSFSPSLAPITNTFHNMQQQQLDKFDGTRYEAWARLLKNKLIVAKVWKAIQEDNSATEEADASAYVILHENIEPKILDRYSSCSTVKGLVGSSEGLR